MLAPAPKGWLSPIGRGKTPAFRPRLEQIFGTLWRMRDSRQGSQTTFAIHLPMVWITKDRHKGLRGEVAERGRPLAFSPLERGTTAA
jgi:hypothetical protein